MATRMQQRRGTAAQWISTNNGNGPILAAGEIGFESDTNKFKIGDGVNHWVDLTYFTDAQSIISAINGIVDGAPDLLNTLNELAAALGDDPNFLASMATTTYVDNAVSSIDLTGYATESYVDTAVSNVTVDLSTAAGTNLDWNAGTSQFDVDTAGLLTSPTISTQLTLDGTGDFTISADANIILVPTTTAYIGSAASGNEIATKSYADSAAASAAAAIVDSAPSTLNTLNELAAAINDDASYAATITTALGNKQDKVSGVSDTEIGYLDGVTAPIQTQIDSKAASNNPTITAPVLVTPEERWTISATAPSSTTNFDADTHGLLYLTANTANDWTLNIRGSSSTTLDSKLAVGDSFTLSLIVTNGATAYKHTALTIDGSAQTVKWSGGTAPSAGNASSIDAYSFTIIKTAANTYTVLGAGPVKYA